MGKDKETKKLDAEELEKRVAPFGDPLIDRSTGDPVNLPGDSTSTDPTGGGHDKPMKK